MTLDQLMLKMLTLVHQLPFGQNVRYQVAWWDRQYVCHTDPQKLIYALVNLCCAALKQEMCCPLLIQSYFSHGYLMIEVVNDRRCWAQRVCIMQGHIEQADYRSSRQWDSFQKGYPYLDFFDPLEQASFYVKSAEGAINVSRRQYTLSLPPYPFQVFAH